MMINRNVDRIAEILVTDGESKVVAELLCQLRKDIVKAKREYDEKVSQIHKEYSLSLNREYTKYRHDKAIEERRRAEDARVVESKPD